jgi:hypothetical protein
MTNGERIVFFGLIAWSWGHAGWAVKNGRVAAQRWVYRDEAPLIFWFMVALYVCMGVGMLYAASFGADR